LAICKADRREQDDRILRIHGDGEVEIYTGGEDGRMLSTYRNCITDGTFPDWRRVIPREDNDCPPETFSHKYLSDFCAAAKDLDKSASKLNPAAVRVYGGGGNPAIIRFRGVDNAFGVLMPLRDNHDGNRLPWFMNAAPAPAEMAVAAE
jgi:hypothetical protein